MSKQLKKLFRGSSVRRAIRAGRMVVGQKVTWDKDFEVKLDGTRDVQLLVGDHTHLAGRIVVRGEGVVRIGSNCHFHRGTFLGSLQEILILDEVFAAEGIFVVDNNNHPTSPRQRSEMTKTDMGGKLWLWTADGVAAASVVIGPCVWLGRNSHVLKGVKVGEGSIVAAAAVVSRDVPPLSVVAGNPAKVVKQLEDDRISI
jgi:acetyltransferase-like isoleucine patch superfamily enzyme